MKMTRCLLLLLSTLLTVSSVFAEAPYFESNRIVDDIWVLNLVPADMDGDGDGEHSVVGGLYFVRATVPRKMHEVRKAMLVR